MSIIRIIIRNELRSHYRQQIKTSKCSLFCSTRRTGIASVPIDTNSLLCNSHIRIAFLCIIRLDIHCDTIYYILTMFQSVLVEANQALRLRIHSTGSTICKHIKGIRSRMNKTASKTG